MAHGGKRPGAGRRKGSVNAKTKKRKDVAAKALESGLTPLDYMLDRLRDKNETAAVRLQCARDAAPYVHPRLAAIEHSGGLDLGLKARSDDELDADIQRAAAEAETAISVARKGAPTKA